MTKKAGRIVVASTRAFGGRAALALLSVASLRCEASDAPPGARVRARQEPSARTVASGPLAAQSAAPRPAASVVTQSPGGAASADATVIPSVEFTTGGASPGDRLPLVIALHGYGDSPQGFATVFAGFTGRARVVLPHSDMPMGTGYMWFELHGVGDSKDSPITAQMADAIMAFATNVAKNRPTAGKPIIAGFSQGGALAYTIAVRHPTAIAAAIPISGWFPRSLLPAARLSRVPPVFSFHGDADSRVPVRMARHAKANLEAIGIPVTLRELPGVEHTIPADARSAIFEVLERLCEAQL
jgi:phospholipase/carboxylesterase